jgi:hypothetical protein
MIEIKNRRGKLLIRSLITLLIGALLGLLCWWVLYGDNHIRRFPIIIFILPVLCLLAGIGMIVRAFGDPVVLTFAENGLVVKEIGSVTIPWSEITACQLIIEKKDSKKVGLFLHNPATLTAALPEQKRKLINQTPGQPNILLGDFSFTDKKEEEVVDLIKAHLTGGQQK